MTINWVPLRCSAQRMNIIIGNVENPIGCGTFVVPSLVISDSLIFAQGDSVLMDWSAINDELPIGAGTLVNVGNEIALLDKARVDVNITRTENGVVEYHAWSLIVDRTVPEQEALILYQGPDYAKIGLAYPAPNSVQLQVLDSNIFPVTVRGTIMVTPCAE